MRLLPYLIAALGFHRLTSNYPSQRYRSPIVSPTLRDCILSQTELATFSHWVFNGLHSL